MKRKPENNDKRDNHDKVHGPIEMQIPHDGADTHGKYRNKEKSKPDEKPENELLFGKMFSFIIQMREVQSAESNNHAEKLDGNHSVNFQMNIFPRSVRPSMMVMPLYES